jgi:hypothetical protein
MLQRGRTIHFLIVPHDCTLQLGKSYQMIFTISRKSLISLDRRNFDLAENDLESGALPIFISAT